MTHDPRPTNHELVLLVDLGSQYTQLIARRVREQEVYCEIVRPDLSAAEVKARGARALILSGGPQSVYQEGAVTLDAELFSLGIPVLGICYGLQLGVQTLGGRVRAHEKREFGRCEITRVSENDDLLFGLPERSTAWMSHGDQIEDPGGVFVTLARSDTCPHAAVRHRELPFYGVQFHPEVHHTEHGRDILRNFLRSVAGLSGDWRMGNLADELVAQIRAQVGTRRVLCGLSGGVDSAVVAALLSRAIGKRVCCVFVDTGLCRKHEADQVREAFTRHFAVDFHSIDASERFLSRLKGIDDPEEKRIRIGHEFIAVFKEVADAIADIRFLAQGTLYPDVIESVAAHGGPTATIKRHHNVGGLPEHLPFALVEPLRLFFKDEVRLLGEALGLPEALVWRHPFPGPGLAVRILGEVTRARCDVLREADAIMIEEIHRAGLYREIWQALTVLLPVRSVGVMGDARTYEHAVALRCVTSTDGMTADFAHIPYEVLGRIATRIINEVRGINRVVYDISSKPPATIEWE